MTRLPFEPKGDLLAARNELRSLLCGMKAEAQEVLEATYTIEDTAFFADSFERCANLISAISASPMASL